MNQVILIGKLGFDPEVREIAKGRKVARMSIATLDKFVDDKQELVGDIQWHTVVAWGQTAELVERTLRKSMKVQLTGKLVHRSWEGRDGKRHHVTEIVLNDFKILYVPPTKTEHA